MHVHDLTLLLNNFCNMRCSYCYFAQGDPGHFMQMDISVARLVIDLYFATLVRHRAQEGFLTLNADGEPLLSQELVLDILEYTTLHEKHTGIRLKKRIATNGTLISLELAKAFARHAVTVEISCDGPEDIQSRQRPMKDRRSSFELIQQSVDYLRVVGVQYTFRAVITLLSVDRLQDVIDALVCMTPSGPVKLRPVRPSDRRVRSPVPPDRFADAYLRTVERAVYTNNPAKLPDWAFRFLIRFDGCRVGYCTAGRGMLWVASDGRIYPCGLLMEPAFCLGSMSNWRAHQDLSTLLSTPPMELLRNVNPTQRYQCVTCEVYDLCQGGCAAVRIDNFDNPREKLLPYCELFRQLGQFSSCVREVHGSGAPKE